MVYAYPDVGRAGLGNMLFPWARCFIWAREHGVPMIAPIWYTFRIGPYLRRETDKRQYQKLFSHDHYISGIHKAFILKRNTIIDEANANSAFGKASVTVTFSGMQNKFEDLYGHHHQIREEFLRIVKPQFQQTEIPYEEYIGIHIRRGDFKLTSAKESDLALRAGKSNQLIPIEWYISVLRSVRNKLGHEYPVVVFSDGHPEELRPILQLPYVTFSKGNEAVTDILGLAGSTVLITSASTFSMWASYLGQPYTIWFPGQKKYNLVVDTSKEIEMDYEQEFYTDMLTS